MAEKLYIDKIPAILWANHLKKYVSTYMDKVVIKKKLNIFSKKVCKYGWQVISIDLPEHGERIHEKDKFNPWNIIPELEILMAFIKDRWSKISLYANSIGAYFSILAYKKRNF